MVTVLAMSALSGRGTVAMWGYPLFLFLGLWLVLNAPQKFEAIRIRRVIAAWAAVFGCLAIAFIANYAIASELRSSLPRGVLPGRRSRA